MQYAESQQHLLAMMMQARQGPSSAAGAAVAVASPPSQRPTTLPSLASPGGVPMTDLPYYTRLGPNDVLLGRGTPCAENEGNIRFRTLVRQHKQEYVAAEKRVRKDAIAREILLLIERERGGKFLRKVESRAEREALGVPRQFKDAWVAVDEETKLQKVKQALRNKDDSAEALMDSSNAAFGVSDRAPPGFPAAAHARAGLSSLNNGVVSATRTNAFPRVGGGLGRGAPGQVDRVLGKADFSVKVGDGPTALENDSKRNIISVGTKNKLLVEGAKGKRNSTKSSATKPKKSNALDKRDPSKTKKKQNKNPKKKRMDYYEQAMKEQRARGVDAQDDEVQPEDSDEEEENQGVPPQAEASPAMAARGTGGIAASRIPTMMMAPNLAAMQQQQLQQQHQALHIPPQGHPGVTNVALMRMKAVAAENARRSSLLQQQQQPGSANSTPLQTPEARQHALLAGGGGRGRGLVSQAPLPMLSPATTMPMLSPATNTNVANPFMRGPGAGAPGPRFGTVGGSGMQRLQQMNANRPGGGGGGGPAMANNKPFSPAFTDMLSDARRNMEFRKMQAQQVAAAMAAAARRPQPTAMGPPGPMAAQEFSQRNNSQHSVGPFMRGSASDHLALRSSAMAADMAMRGSAILAGGLDMSSSGGPHVRRMQGLTSGDSVGERALGVGIAMKRAEAFSMSESLQLAHFETMILSVLCSHGLPVWTAETATESFRLRRTGAPGMFDFTWVDLANVLVDMTNEWDRKMGGERDPHPRDGRIMERAVALADYFKKDPKELAKKAVMLLEKLRRQGGSGPAGQQKQWSGIGVRVPLWLERELGRWGMTLGVCDPTGRPVPCSVADFLAEHPEYSDDDALVATTALDAILTGDVFDQVALLTRMRAVFRHNGRTEMWSKLAGAVQKAEASGEGWGAQPTWWGLPNNDDASRLSHEMLLLGRLLVSGFSGVLSSTSDGMSQAPLSQDSINHPSFESLGLTKSAIQQRACQITRELHLIEESTAMGKLLEERMAKMMETVSAGGPSPNTKSQADAALRLLAGASEVTASPVRQPRKRSKLAGITANGASKKRKFDP